MLKKILLTLLFPKKCFGCGKSGNWLCSLCKNKITLYQGEFPHFLKDSKNLIIYGQYQDPILKKLIHSFKFQSNSELAEILGELLITTISKKLLINSLSNKLWKNPLIIPLPLHQKRKKWRGFNQSQLLAQEISHYYHWPLNLSLIKTRQTAIQNELSKQARRLNQLNAFNWRGSSLENKTILLIDDVITSGATLNEAEKVLLAAGAQEVIKIALAKG